MSSNDMIRNDMIRNDMISNEMSSNDAPREGGNTARPLRTALDAELARAGEDADGNKAKVSQLIARRLAAKALDGDLAAIREIFDRVEGKATVGSPPDETPAKLVLQWKDTE
jgi:hypothetical protein